MLSGELVSGTRLRQEALAEEFGVSRTPIREALRKLQASGLVELNRSRRPRARAVGARRSRDRNNTYGSSRGSTAGPRARADERATIRLQLDEPARL